MEKDSTKPLCIHPALRKICVVNDKTSYGFLEIRTATDSRNKMTVDWINDTPPVDTAIVHEAIESILLAAEQSPEIAIGINTRILYRKERKQNDQLGQLYIGKLAVRILYRSDHFTLYDETAHYAYYTLYCLAGIIMFEEVLQFTDYMSIFCLWLKCNIFFVLLLQYSDNQ